MAELLAIANWEENFENNRTRGLKEMAWVPIPNKMDGDGYTELLEHPNGAAHYGAWLGCVLTASRCHPRGTLLRSTREPHDSNSLARITRIPVAVIEEALPRLIRMGWIERKSFDSKDKHLPAAAPHESAAAPQGTDYGMERNGTERKEEDTPLPPEEFEAARERFSNIWNSASGVRQCSSFSSGRESSLRRRLGESVLLEAVRWPWLDALEEVVRKKFPLKLTRGDPNGWKPDVDWILKPDSLPAIIEGKYDWEKNDGKRNRNAGPGQKYDPNYETKPSGVGLF